MRTAIHITHEAVQKMGGIGAVISGLITAEPYLSIFDNTLLYAPLFNYDCDGENRLGDNGDVLYSAPDGIDKGDYGKLFGLLEEKYNIKIIYGKKKIFHEMDSSQFELVDVVLVDIFNINPQLLGDFKFRIWKTFGIQSEMYNDWDYEQYFRIALPYLEILQLLYRGSTKDVHFAHEYMGVPCMFPVYIEKQHGSRKEDETIFYAHEVSTARNVVENHPGHDLAFYNIMENDLRDGISMEATFGTRKGNYRNELIKSVLAFDYVFAVGDYTAMEYKYLLPDESDGKIETVYNGIHITSIDYEKKLESRKMLQEYCEALFNFTPDYLFSHVTRLVISKGLWRDIKMLEYLDKIFTGKGKKGFFVLLSSLLVTGRKEVEITQMERDYGWPVLHRSGYPDLVGMEEDVYRSLEIFNAKSKAIKGVFINQYGFEQGKTGSRIPENASFPGLRAGSDMELGLSTYEPFGIAQLETFAYGGLPVLSKACGCSFLIEDVCEGNPDLFHVIDFAEFPAEHAGEYKSKQDYLSLSTGKRDVIEDAIIKENAGEVYRKLKYIRENEKEVFGRMGELSDGLTWKTIVKDRIAPLLK